MLMCSRIDGTEVPPPPIKGWRTQTLTGPLNEYFQFPYPCSSTFLKSLGPLLNYPRLHPFLLLTPILLDVTSTSFQTQSKYPLGVRFQRVNSGRRTSLSGRNHRR